MNDALHPPPLNGEEQRGSMTFRWTGKAAAILASLVSLATFTGTHVLDKTMQDQRQDDRLAALEETMREVRTIQNENTAARIRQTAVLEENAAALADLRVSEKELLTMLAQHEQHTKTTLNQLEHNSDPPPRHK